MDFARKEGFWIVGAEANGEYAPWEVDMNQPLFILMGGGDSGLRRLTRENCDQIVRLPTPRQMSLNAADALTVFLYETNRQKVKANKNSALGLKRRACKNGLSFRETPCIHQKSISSEREGRYVFQHNSNAYDSCQQEAKARS